MGSSENEEELEFEPPRAHNPAAPLHESFDISSTVDPSNLISLIRRLLPSDVKDCEYAAGTGSVIEKPRDECQNKHYSCLGENDEVEEMEYSDKHIVTKHGIVNQDSLGPGNGDGVQRGSAVETTWEECGCILWDLSASEEHAQFMVQNLILDVLLANLMVSRSSRVTEICLGILGNIACHEFSQEQLMSTNGLAQVIVEQFLLDDVPILCETCRVLTLCLQGTEGVKWAEILQAEPFISRIFWITENTLNSLLLSKVVDLLLAVLESRADVSSILLPHMIKLDLSSLLVKLFEFEMSKLRDRISERYDSLDLILRTIEALSAMDVHSHQICLNRRLWELVIEIIELPEKYEVATSCITAAVVVANIIAESDDFALLLLKDVNFLQGLFDVLSFCSNDNEAKTAIWSVIARLLKLLNEKEMNTSTFYSLVSILLSKAELIEDEIIFPLHSTSITQTDTRFAAVKSISNILYRWNEETNKSNSGPKDSCFITKENIDKLLQICHKVFM